MTLYTSKLGAGEPVLLLHSSGMSSRQWRKLSEKLSATHQVIAPDFIGSGDNPSWAEDKNFTFHQDVDEVTSLLEGISAPLHVVGHSYGGLIALTLARQMPSRIRSLCVYDPVAFGVLYKANDTEGINDLEASGKNAAFSDLEKGGNEAWFEAFIDYWNGPNSWNSLAPATKESFLRVGRKVFYEVCTLLQDRTPAAAYAIIEAPSLLLSGEKSPIAARHVLALIAAAMPNADLQTVEGAGHMGPFTHMYTVNQRIIQHIKNVDNPSGD